VRRNLLRTVSVLILGLVSAGTPLGARPASAIPPHIPFCDSEDDIGKRYTELVALDSADYVVWECKKGPYFGYFFQIVDYRNAEDDAREFSEDWSKFLGGEAWQAIVDAGLGIIDTDGNYANDNIDSTVSFQLHGPSGSPIYRTLGARILVGYSRYSSGPFGACSDTGWKTSAPNVSAFSLKLQYGNGGKCGTGYYRLQGAGEFLSVSTGQWTKTGWVYTDPLYVIGPQ